MTKPSSLVLEDGTVFAGDRFGAETPAYGEVVFNTSMTGYQEILTDPSYAGQIVVLTYPLIGNYGINTRDFESKKVQVAGLVVRHHSDRPSHTMSTSNLDQFLAEHGVPGISGLDTRALTRRLRTHGVMMGVIALNKTPEDALTLLKRSPAYEDVDYVARVSTEEPYKWTHSPSPSPVKKRVVVEDYGLKYNILRILRSKGCEVIAMPSGASVDDILSLQPDGIVLSPGPGDPELLDYAVATVRGVIGKVPVLGICLGNQVLARALGGKTFKLKFGHRGGNHPVRDMSTGRIYITSQNHGYAVDPDSLPADLEISHVSLNDGTVEGLHHKSLPAMSIQYHSEASPGPLDNAHIFDSFLKLIDSTT